MPGPPRGSAGGRGLASDSVQRAGLPPSARLRAGAREMGLRTDTLMPLFMLLLLLNYICIEAALKRKSSAANFLSRGREKLPSRCLRGCNMESSEAEESLEANSDYEESLTARLNDGSKLIQNSGRVSVAASEEGSGM